MSEKSEIFVNFTEFPRAGFRRRLAAWVYDVLIAFAVYMVAGAVGFGIFALLVNSGVINGNGEAHVISVLQNSWSYIAINELWKFAWVSYFFVFFWSRSGQTIGMQAWRLRVQNTDGSLISKVTGIKRLLPTLLGLGNLAVLVDRTNKLSLADRFTNTEVVLLSLEANRK